MNLTEAIDLYVSRRHAEGSTYVNGENVLRSMCRQVGNVPLSQLATQQVSDFLNRSGCSALTRRGRYSMVRRFLTYWSIRDEAPTLKLLPPAKASVTFDPYIYSPRQIAAILAAVKDTQASSRIVTAGTLRMFLLTLYATGGVFNEVLQIRSSQLDLERCELVLNGNQRVCSRRIPICLDLSRELRLYLRGRFAEDASDCTIFASISGQPLTNSYLTARFQRLLQAADITRRDGIRRSPRMKDFRASFAVHRLETWIKEKGNLDRLLPSLSTYMGYSSLCAARKYLRFTPDHLRAHIAKLSEPSSAAMDMINTSFVKASP